MPESFHKVVKADDVVEQAVLAFVVNRWPVMLTRDEGTIRALLNRCSHAASPLAPQGRVRRGAVMCPLHGARFKLDTGECLGGADYKPLLTFACREGADGWIEVAVPDEAPGAEHIPVTPLS